jgi:hypothetical protein
VRLGRGMERRLNASLYITYAEMVLYPRTSTVEEGEASRIGADALFPNQASATVASRALIGSLD